MIFTCIVSGIEKKLVKSVRQKGINRFGSIEEFQKYFVSREAKKLLKQRIQPEDVQRQLLPKSKKPFPINREALVKLKLLKKARKGFTRAELMSVTIPKTQEKRELSLKDYVESLTTTACLRPDIFLDNDRKCDFCPYVKFCLCPVKKVSKHYKD
jgi:hypothetical protein